MAKTPYSFGHSECSRVISTKLVEFKFEKCESSKDIVKLCNIDKLIWCIDLCRNKTRGSDRGLIYILGQCNSPVKTNLNHKY